MGNAENLFTGLVYINYPDPGAACGHVRHITPDRRYVGGWYQDEYPKDPIQRCVYLEGLV